MSAGADPPASRRGVAVTVARNIGGLVLVLVAFYLLPVNTERNDIWHWGVSLLALAGLAVVAVRQLRSDDTRVIRLVMMLVIVVVAFAYVCYAVAINNPGQFVGIKTRTDALYFTVVTMTTVGFGDIHPAGQAARVLVIFLIAFDVAIVGTLVSAIGTRVRENEVRRRRHD